MSTRSVGRAATAPVAALLLSVAALALTGCAEGLPATQGLSGTVVVDGSSSLAPLVAAGVEEFGTEVEPGVVVDLTTSGTAGGAARLCDGTADVALVSRPLTVEEERACAEAGVEHVGAVLANDAITVVVPARSDAVRCLDTDELRRLWSDGSDAGGGPARTWADVREGLPATVLVPFAPGPASGTADLFAERVLDGGAQRADAARSEDDDVIAQGVAASPGGVGYLPLSYALRNDEVRAVAVDAGDGCVPPRAGTVADGTYPLSRELHVHVSVAAYEGSRSVAGFVDYLLARSDRLADATGSVPRSTEQHADAHAVAEGLAERAEAARTGRGEG